MLSYALNQMTASTMQPDMFIRLAAKLGCEGVEFRNDLSYAIFSGINPSYMKKIAEEADVEILALSEVKEFNDFSNEVMAKALALVKTAEKCNARGISLIPRVGGDTVLVNDQASKLLEAMIALQPLLEDYGLIGYIEPIGFADSTLRYKKTAVDVIDELDANHCFQIIHDTFHHYLADETEYYASHTGIVHISGVNDATIARADIRDEHRVLVDAEDRLNNLEQLRILTEQGYMGPVSMEAFSPIVHSIINPKKELLRSFEFIDSGLAGLAA